MELNGRGLSLLTWLEANGRKAAGAAAGLWGRDFVRSLLTAAQCLSDARKIPEAGRPRFRINAEESEDRGLDVRA